MTTHKRSMTLAFLFATTAAGLAWSPALAQDTAPSASSGVDEVVVTARRREEVLKDVPVAVSAFSADKLERVSATDITGLQQTTPNLTLQVARGSNSTLISFIRGVGQQDPLWGFEPGVGLYVDDVYIARPQGAVLDIFDVERIEVLRGPQGTLYGRNTIGGAIKYVTKRLGNDPRAMIRGTVGSYNERDLVLSGSTPVGVEGLSVGGALALYKRDGYGTNLTTRADTYNKDVIAGRLSLEYAPNENLFVRLAYDKVQDDSNPRHGHREAVALQGGFPILANKYDTQAGIGDSNSVETEGASLTAQLRLSPTWSVKNIFAWRRGRTDTVIDFDNTPLPTLDIPAFYEDRSVSNELQFLYDGERVQGVAGLYYMDAKAEGHFDTIAGNLGVAIGDGGSVDTRSLAAFADVSFDFTDRLKGSIGGRFTRDEKTGRVFRATYLGAFRTPSIGGPARAPLVLNTNYTRDKTFEEFTPRVSLSYDLTEDLTTYVSYSKGFKSGGFDMRGDASLTPQTVNGYEPETVQAYELGLKGSFFDRLTFASAVFLSKYKGQQFTTQVPVPTGIASSVDNVGESSIKGAEFEGQLKIADGFVAAASVGYIDAKFDKFNRFDPVSRTNINVANLYVFQNTPKWTANINATYSHEVAGGRFSITPSISYRSSYSQFEQVNVFLDQEAYTLVDLNAQWTAPSGRYKISLSGKNLTDERYKIGGYSFAGATFNNSLIAYYGPPKTFLASLEVNF